MVQHLAVGQPRLRDVRSTAPAVTRSAALLRLLAQTEIDPPGLAELARLLDLPKSSVANLCAALEDVDLVRKVDGRYFLGRLVLELGGAYIRSVSYLQDFAESCRALRVASQETILLAQLDSRDILYLARHDGNQPVRLASDIGRRLPANCTSLGKAMLAQLEPETVVERFGELSSFPVLTERSKRNVEELLVDLEATRERGYAIDDEENTLGITCLGVAIPRTTQRGPYRAVSVTLLKARVTEELCSTLVGELTELASGLAERSAMQTGVHTQ